MAFSVVLALEFAMSKFVIVLNFVILTFIATVNSANILGLFVVASPSHHIW